MRLTRVFVDAPLATGTSLALPEGPAGHLARVLRTKPGDALVVFNGQGGEFAASVESVARNAVTVRVGAHDAIERESPLDTTLLQGMARGEKMDQILQKATELGVTRVVPVMTVRSNVRLDDDTAARKQQHWQGVVVAACEQCGRTRVPQVARPVDLAAAVESVDAETRLVLAPLADAAALGSLLRATSPARSIAMLIGPEGGLAPDEIAAAQRAGFRACRVGPRVLRTETAAQTVLAALQFAAGDLQ